MPQYVNHLGGHQGKTWVDPGALQWAYDYLGIRRMIDVGCGPGGMFSIAQDIGIEWTGIDGDPEVQVFDKPIVRWDFTIGVPDLCETDYYDLGWSVEFVEHVEEKYIPNFMEVFKRCEYVIITHALPGAGGYHHVNEQTSDYWIDVFKNYGLVYKSKLTSVLKRHSTMKKRDGQSFLDKSGLLFYNRGNDA